MKDWQRAHRRAQLYEQLCVLADALFELTAAWWNADPELCDLPPRSYAQLELPLSEPEPPTHSATPPELD